jgi:hypothetical protein
MKTQHKPSHQHHFCIYILIRIRTQARALALRCISRHCLFLSSLMEFPYSVCVLIIADGVSLLCLCLVSLLCLCLVSLLCLCLVSLLCLCLVSLLCLCSRHFANAVAAAGGGCTYLRLNPDRCSVWRVECDMCFARIPLILPAQHVREPPSPHDPVHPVAFFKKQAGWQVTSRSR